MSLFRDMLMSTSFIPFSRTHVTGKELTYIADAVNSRRLSGPGPHSEACERLIRQTTGSAWIAVVPSCTAALEMSALLLDLNPGDEVIVPSYTFVSTATAVALRGAVPVFVDVDPVTLNICPRAVARAITPRTRAIFVIHYAGVVADMAALADIASNSGLVIVEDAAQAYGSSRAGRSAGSFGVTSCFSFHGTKNISAGEGGALAVNDPKLIERAAILREKGTDRDRFLRGLVSAYSWQDIGSSQIVSEITAAFLRAQLEHADAIQTERRMLWQAYHDALRCAEDTGHFHVPHPPDEVQHNGHIFFLMLPDSATRRDLSETLAAAGIGSATHYVPLHASPAGRRFGRVSGDMTVTNKAAECLLRLPLWNGLGKSQERVIDAVLDWCASRTVTSIRLHSSENAE
jgi:dTDP-4-amino-4,6-dideoxygalactose transaminase